MFRFFHVAFLLLRYFFTFYFPLKVTSATKPKLLRNFLEDAGGAFIKFGQLLALRVDILPAEYFLELIDLYDNIKPFSYNLVKQTINYELGSPPDKIFSYFEKEPFASASFGQVHAAKVKNEKVIVKVQRPGIENIIDVDFFIIDILSFIGDLFFKIEALPWRDFAKEFKSWTRKELDYRIEAGNAQLIFDNVSKVHDSLIVIPKTYHYFTAKKVLVQEYIDGIPLSRVLRGLKDKRLTAEKLKKLGVDIKKAPKILVSEMMREYFFDGMYHADPHPGNILLLQNGRIGIIDFGIIGESSPKREAFYQFVKAGGESFYDESSYEKIGYYFLEFASDSLQQIIRSVLPADLDDSYLEQFYHLLANHFAITLKEMQMNIRRNLNTLKIDYTIMLIQGIKYAQRFQIKLPKQMIVFIRALSIIGFLAKQMDYNFNAGNLILEFCKKHPVDSIPPYVAENSYKRMNREEAIDRLNSWLAYLIEIDPKLYHIVNKFISQYNRTK